ncbi:MFS transporter [Lentithecium fluviatile CBS 122367]|uniref:MFS transporter n=1 Tax=Lentithecium fluviatile CBS 122367 TaxID=1168545 RepID=A0A6G1J181_9PLEO|nr:MFS transporter [Lentithecium fluviatile CBS 122367]
MGATREEIVPGTVLFVDTDHGVYGKHLGGDKDIVLVPQPSQDPEDPLNWSPKRKGLAIGMVFCYTLGVAISTAVQYSVLTPIAEDTGITVAQLNLGTGLMFLFLGWANLIWQPLALVYGRRGVFLLSSFLCVWPSLPEVSVPDLFFAHNRGGYMGIYAFLLFGGNFLKPFLAGWIDFSGGWRWTMYFGAIVQAVTTIIIFFWTEETMYFRSALEGEEDSVQANDCWFLNARSRSGAWAHEVFWKKMALFMKMPGRPSKKAMLTMMWRPLPIMYHFPTVSWAGFAAPYNFSSGLDETAYLSPLVAAALGAVWSGWSTDKLAIRLARRNHGIREPEQRLWALLLSGILCSAGLILWGVGAARDVHWFGAIFGLGLLAFSVICGASITLSYAVDSFKEIAGEAMTSVIIIRNTLGFAVSYGINPWIDTMGVQNCFITVAMVALVCTFTFLPMVVFGKRLRKFSAPKYWEYVATSAVEGH